MNKKRQELIRILTLADQRKLKKSDLVVQYQQPLITLDLSGNGAPVVRKPGVMYLTLNL